LGTGKLFRFAHSMVTGVAYTVTPRAAVILGKMLPSMNQRELAPYLKCAGSPVTGTGRRSAYFSSRYCQVSCGSSTCESASTTTSLFISSPSDRTYCPRPARIGAAQATPAAVHRWPLLGRHLPIAAAGCQGARRYAALALQTD